MKKYDVWFIPEGAANFVVEANSYEEASEIAEEVLCNMDQEELMCRISDAIDFMGVKIEDVVEIEGE